MAKGSGLGKEKANMSGEAYVKGRQAGVEDTYGDKNARLPGNKRVAERTAASDRMDQSDSGSVHSEVTDKAHSMYQDAVMNSGDKYGDRALTER